MAETSVLLPPSATPEALTAAPAERRRTLRAEALKRAFGRYKILALVIAIMLIWALFGQLTDGDFLSPRNLSNLLRQMAITGMLACGMVFVIISGEIDLSVGSLLGLLGGIAAILDVSLHLPLALNIVLVVAAGALIGAFNGYWVAYLRVPSFIVTLAGLLAFRGVLLGITGGVTIAPVSASLVAVAQSYLPNVASYVLALLLLSAIAFVTWQTRNRRAVHGLAPTALWLDVARVGVAAVVIFGFVMICDAYRGLPIPVVIVLVLLGLFTLMAQRTVFGRRIYAVGGNLEATRFSGVNVQMVKLLVFALMGCDGGDRGDQHHGAPRRRLAVGRLAAGAGRDRLLHHRRHLHARRRRHGVRRPDRRLDHGDAGQRHVDAERRHVLADDRQRRDPAARRLARRGDKHQEVEEARGFAPGPH